MLESRNEVEIVLGVLNAVECDARVSQRRVAKELGIALGLTNAYIKRCIRKGFIKAQQIPANRLAYYLTPQGLAEKTRLTAEYLTQGLQFFRIARENMESLYGMCDVAGYRRLVVHGLTDIAEIAILSVGDRDIEIVCIVDQGTPRTTYSGIRIVRELPPSSEFDAIVIADLKDAQQNYDAISAVVAPERILVPEILRVSRRHGPAVEP